MEENLTKYEKEDGIAVITLNRPDKLNSLTPGMRVGIRRALEDVENDKNVKGVIITGEGRGFCAGADVISNIQGTEMADDEPPRARLLLPVSTLRIVTILRELNKPSIAAVNGVVAGSGCSLMLACDIILASDQARFRIAFTRLGMGPGDGLTFLMPRRIGTHRTLELAYTNDIIDAKEMDRIGLVNRLVPHEELLQSAKDLIKRTFQIPPLTLAFSKRAIYRGFVAPDLETQRAFDGFIGSKLGATEDKAEATKSFMEKRDPVYKGE